MTTTEYLERRAFYAGFHAAGNRGTAEFAWKEYCETPQQLELPLEAPNDQADKL